MDRALELRSTDREEGIRLVDCLGSADLRAPELEGWRWGAVRWGSGLEGADLAGAWRRGSGLAGEDCAGFWRGGMFLDGVVAPLEG
jgi:hypothetical protein